MTSKDESRAGYTPQPWHAALALPLLLVALGVISNLAQLEEPSATNRVPPPTKAEPEQPLAPPPPLAKTPTDGLVLDRGTETVASLQLLRGEPQAELVRKIRSGKPVVRTTALTILWVRGQRDLATKEATGDPLLEAQLRALEARERRLRKR